MVLSLQVGMVNLAPPDDMMVILCNKLAESQFEKSDRIGKFVDKPRTSHL